jgi:uncharacterized protein YecE (DUF72 family)
MELRVMARALLPARSAGGALAGVLRDAIRHGGNQQLVLPAAGSIDVCHLAHARPTGISVSVKASRFLTHMKRLLDPEDPLQRLFSSVSGLGRRLGPVLYQLPPTLTLDLPRLDRFLRALPRSSSGTRLHVVEFRHPSWYIADTFELLRRRRVALCLHDKLGSPIREPLVGPFVYVRFHGTSGRYHGSYSRRQLDRWAHVLADQIHRGRRVFAYFNNDPEAVATANALTLREKIDRIL